MFKFQHKDNMLYGIKLGAILPFALMPLIYGLVFLLSLLPFLGPFMTLNSIILLSIAPNFLIIRHLLSKLKYEAAGRGALFISVGYLMLFFLFLHKAVLFPLPGLE